MISDIRRMKKWFCRVTVLALVCILVLAGCGRSMDDIIASEPSIAGVVRETGETSILIENETGEYWVSLDVENKDSVTHFNVGDEVVVYYDGSVAETYPMQIHTVYAITLRTPAERSDESLTPTGYLSGEVQQPQVVYNGQVYLYFATGFDEPLPEGFVCVGTVQAVDNTKEPEMELHGARVEPGQEVYAREEEPDIIYLRYDSGYAEFRVRQ